MSSRLSIGQRMRNRTAAARPDLSQPISTSLGLECAKPAEMRGQSQSTAAWLDRHVDYPVPEAGKRQASRLQQLSHHRS
jgi:hypothetical protein